ncbi:hypothetical protein RIR_jg15967.t1 [Rhizophagus irregularis DAOM 181602=DAOM 197198]|nr:hypothetical protein RIR_jg15967.t1 [Rhizophagus irregularis DAOM 181602=DAOM 197198]
MNWEYSLTKTRPIILLETLRKVLVKIVTKRLSKVIAERNILKGGNHAGLPGGSTEAPLRIINTCIEDAKKNNKELWLTFQDLSKAYDSKKSVIKEKGIMKQYTTIIGIDQGEVISPLLWTIYYDPLLAEINSLKMGYEIEHCFKNEFNIINNIQTNYDKFEMITNKKLDKDIVEVNFRSSKRMVKPLTSKESVRILGVWINLDLRTNYVFNQCKNIIKRYNKTISFKQITDLQMKYIYNHVIIPRVDYKVQLLVWTNSQTEKLNSTCRYMFKRKASLPLTTPNSIIHSSLGYAIKDINTIQAQRQLSRLYNQVISKGVMKDIFEIDCKQLQSELLSNKSPLHSDVKVNQIQGGLLPIVEIYTHKEIFTNGISKGLKGKNVYFASQLMSSNGIRLLRYKDLKHRIKINTQGRIPSWFKFIETKLIEDPLKSKKVKTDFQLGYNIHSVNTKIDNLKTKNWITTFHDQIGKPIIGRVLDNPNEDKIRIEHWIQDLENDQISPSVQLPILKKCEGCEVKTNQIRNKKSNTKVRCIADINIENCVKVSANSIQNDHYIADMAIYEALTQAEH